jgi:predicted GNAT superfamily acetyltransferase
MSTAAQPTTLASTFVTAQAGRVAVAAARRAGVEVHEVEDIAELKAISALVEAVWGRTDEGAPLHSEVLRSLVHAGGSATAAYGPSGDLLGAAALSVAAPTGSTYSLIAAVAPGTADRGIGHAIKLQQRAWALSRGYSTMTWTFDPLVSRNARFNLVKLGAVSEEYEASFYGQMSDAINGDDDSDRLVARWELASRRAVAASEGTGREPAPSAAESQILQDAPDGGVLALRDAAGTWVRVPTDIVALRRSDPTQAAGWRRAVRDALAGPLADGLVATHMTRDGWYLLTRGADL